MNKRALTRDERWKLRDCWLALWKKKHVPSVEESWYEAVIDFVHYGGGQVVSEETKLLEYSVIEKGKSDEYIQLLLSTVTSGSEDLDDADKMILVLNATPNERERALKVVLAVGR